MTVSSSFVLGVIALLVGMDAMADDGLRMGELERSRFRAELLRQDISNVRPGAGVTRPEVSSASGAGVAGARLSPEERRALREQLRQNPIPFDIRSPRRQH